MERAAEPAPAATPPPLRRDRDGAIIGGVCAGLGRRLGIDPIVLRIVFIAASAAGGLGLFAYALAWALLPAVGESRANALRVPGSRDSWSVACGIGLLMLAVLLLFREWGLWIGDGLVWPVVLAAAGGAMIWRQSARAADPAPAARAERRQSGGSALGRAALGVALVVGAALIFLYFNDALKPARDVLLPVVVVLVAGTLILAPWWIRLVRGLADERAERVRSQERAELAAHLHDSVLQTLALMQRQRGQPARGRRPRPPPGARAARVAQRRPPVRRALDARRRARARRRGGGGGARRRRSTSSRSATARSTTSAEALVAAAREAIVNAAKFAGAEAGLRVRRDRRRARSRCSCATAAPASTPTRCPPTAAACASRSSGACAATAATPAVHTAAGTGTEVELTLERGR